MSETPNFQLAESPLPRVTATDEEMIPIDQIQPLQYSARESNHEVYQILYQSIKEEGIQHPFVVARNPSSDHYSLIAGGNTRLEIVKHLYEESRDSLFHELPCIVQSWPGDCAAKIRHLVANDIPNKARLIERAKAVLNFIESSPDLPINRTTSDRKVSDYFNNQGYPLYRTTYGAMKYAVDFLDQYLPLSLASSFNTLDVQNIQRLEAKLKRDWLAVGKPESEFNQLFAEIATCCDHEDLDYETLRSELTEQIRATLPQMEEPSASTVPTEQSVKENLSTRIISRMKELQPKRGRSTTPRATRDQVEEDLSSEFLNDTCKGQEADDPILNIVMELARRFGLQDLLTMEGHGEFGFLVVDLPSDDASTTSRVVWEYLANFSGARDMVDEELISHLSSESKLYREIQEHGTSISLQTAQELDLSVMWTLDEESFELLLQLWQLLYEHSQVKPAEDEFIPRVDVGQPDRLAA